MRAHACVVCVYVVRVWYVCVHVRICVCVVTVTAATQGPKMSLLCYSTIACPLLCFCSLVILFGFAFTLEHKSRFLVSTQNKIIITITGKAWEPNFSSSALGYQQSSTGFKRWYCKMGYVKHRCLFSKLAATRKHTHTHTHTHMPPLPPPHTHSK